MPRVVLITGAGRGFGHALAQVFLDAGEHVVATTRDPSSFDFQHTRSDNFLALKLDVTSNSDIDAAFQATLEKFKRIDIVINNAAYGLLSPMETLTEAQIRDQFDTNFFPVFTITRKAVSIMREQTPSGGLVVQVSSTAGVMGHPTMSGYAASKFAIEGFTEAVRGEMKPEWGIKLMCVQPGHLNTEAQIRSMVYGEIDVPAYDHLDARALTKSFHGSGADTTAVAQTVYTLSKLESPPLKTPITGDCLDLALMRMRRDEALLTDKNLVELARRNGKPFDGGFH